MNDHSRILFLGDFNFHMLDPNDKTARAFQTLLTDLGFSIGRPQISHSRGNALNLIITKGFEVVSDCCSPLFWTDHFLLQANISIWAQATTKMTEAATKIKPSKCTIRPLRNFDAPTFANQYFSIKYSRPPPSSPTDIDLLADRIDEDLRTTLDYLHPLKWVSSKSPLHAHNKWYTEELLNTKREGRRLERVWRGSGLNSDRLRCQIHNTKYRLQIVEAKKDFIKAEMAKAGNNHKALFKLCEQFSGQAHSKQLHNHSPLSAQTLSNFFSDKVSSICARVSNPLPTVCPVSPNPLPTLFSPRETKDSNPEGDILSSKTLWRAFQIPSKDELLNLISKLKDSTSPLDVLPIQMFKSLAPFLLDDIERMITLSLTSGTVPRLWKKAAVTPILKKTTADPADPASFRPISQLCIWARIIEAWVSPLFRNHLEAQGCLHDRQVGFRAGRSTEDAILEMRESALSSLEKGNKPATILLDFSAAFDTVNHQILLQRLDSLGQVGGTILKWFSSFLTDRLQSVKFQDSWGVDSPLQTGVPQGSMLSPTLFNIYTTPLAHLLDDQGVTFVIYADDVQLQVNSAQLTTHPDLLVDCLSNIYDWTSKNQLALNPSKTELLYRHSKEDPSNWPFKWPSMMTVPTPVQSVRNLGILVDPEFSPVCQVDQVAKQCHFLLWRLGRFCPLLDFLSRKRLVEAIVLSRLTYCCTIFAGATALIFSRLQAIQNRAIRLVCGLRKFDHLSAARSQTGWPSVENLVNLRLVSWMWKITRHHCPTFALNWVTERTMVRTLRSFRPFRTPIPSKRSAGGRSFALLAPKIWYTLPTKIQETPFACFKKRALRVLQEPT